MSGAALRAVCTQPVPGAPRGAAGTCEILFYSFWMQPRLFATSLLMPRRTWAGVSRVHVHLENFHRKSQNTRRLQGSSSAEAGLQGAPGPSGTDGPANQQRMAEPMGAAVQKSAVVGAQLRTQRADPPWHAWAVRPPLRGVCPL